MYLHCVHKMIFYIEIGHFLEKPQEYDVCGHNIIQPRIQHLDKDDTFLRDQMCVNKEGEQYWELCNVITCYRGCKF
jgi:hypothetical protein